MISWLPSSTIEHSITIYYNSCLETPAAKITEKTVHHPGGAVIHNTCLLIHRYHKTVADVWEVPIYAVKQAIKRASGLFYVHSSFAWPHSFLPTAHPGHLQAAEPCLPHLPSVQLWEWVDGAGPDRHRGPASQWLRHWCLQEPIFPGCFGLDAYFLHNPRPCFFHAALAAQQVYHT